MPKTSEDIQLLLKKVVDEVEKEDQSVREQQIRQWRYYALLWEGFSNIWWDDVAHDWRIWSEEVTGDDDQAAYDRPINILRAYLESIIAALSVSIPPIKAFPDDATNPLDLATATASDKIAQLVYRHNDAPLKWLHSLFTFSRQGMIACHHYSRSDESYGTYKVDKTEDEEKTVGISKCPTCGNEINAAEVPPEVKEKIGQQKDKFDPGSEDIDINNELLEYCPVCDAQVIPLLMEQKLIVTSIVGETEEPKSRVCLDIYGGLYVKIPNYAKNQATCPYLRLGEEFNFTDILQRYEHLREDTNFRKQVTSGSSTNVSGYTSYEQWGRLSPQYQGMYPTNIVTQNTYWLRPMAFNYIQEEDAKKLRAKYPNGCKAVFCNDCFCEADNESLDDNWTVMENPLADYVHFQPEASLLTSVQSITNDLISLIFQTIQHGITQTFADDGVLDFDAYKAQEVMPGGVFPVTAKAGKSIGDSFHDLKTATLSPEVMPFQQYIQSLGQVSSGALPSLFGGEIEGSGTASEYSMSRAQALQRQNNKWKMFTSWWKTIFSKVIPMYIKNVKEDERYVERTKDGNFVNVLIRKSELEGKIGQIELEANENLPITWAQRSDKIMKLLESSSPQMMAFLNAPENLPLLHEALGLVDFTIPGEDDVNLQYNEIKILLNSEPVEEPAEDGQMAEIPSVEIDPIYNNHPIHFEICRKWVISDEGQQAKLDNPAGFRNVVLHGIDHYKIMNEQAMQAQQAEGATPDKKPKETNQEAPITGESNVATA